VIYIALTYLFSPILHLLLFFRSRAGCARQLSVGKAHPTPFLQKQAGEHILVIQTAKIGDLICSTPVFRVVKKRYPDAHLTAIVNPAVRGLLEYNPYINEIIEIERGFYKGFAGKIRLARMLHKGGYDIAISLNPNVPFTLAMFWGLIPIRISIIPDFFRITYRLASIFSNHLAKHIRGRLVAETYMEMLKAIGIDSKDIAKDVFKSPDADDKVEGLLNSEPRTLNSKLKIGIAVTSGNRLKEWGAKNIAALADKLIAEKNSSVVLIGSEKDKDVADEILKSILYKDSIIDAVGKFSLQELPALIERLSLFIGVDTGVIYMADALNIPVVDIAGPSDMEDQRPTGKRVTIIQKKDIECVPCSHTFSAPYECRYGHRECIVSVSIDDVFDSAKRLLSRT